MPRPVPSAASPRPPDDDAALAQQLAAGDEAAFRAIYERYWRELYRLAWRKLDDRAAAEEIVQELFVDLWHKRESRRIEHLPSYLHAALRYGVADHLRAEYHRKKHLTLTSPPAEEAPLDHATEQALAADDLERALARRVEQLPAPMREVFRLSRLEHQSVPEIAARLHLSPKTVEYHLTRALKLLRGGLRDFLLLVALLNW